MGKGRTWEESKPGERIESEGVEGVYPTLERLRFSTVGSGDASTMAGRGKGVSGKGMTSVGARVDRVFLAMGAPGNCSSSRYPRPPLQRTALH